MLKSLILCILTLILAFNCISANRQILVFRTVEDKEQWKKLNKVYKIVYEDKNILEVNVK